MIERKPNTPQNSSELDDDDIPDTSGPKWAEVRANAVVSHGNKIISGDNPRIIKALRGRPPLAEKKIATSIRLDQGILEFYKASGPLWQTRLNDDLRRFIRMEVAERDRGNKASHRTRSAAASKVRKKS